MTGPRPRPDLEGLAPYRTSESRTGRIFLHANENPYPLPDDVMREIAETTARLRLNRYPDTDSTELRRELASYAGVDPEWIWVGDGSNEVLLQICLAYGGPDRTALIFEPTYRMHYRQARMAGTAVEVCPRGSDFAVDAEAALGRIGDVRPDVTFVCVPNNPTGTLTPSADLVRIASAVPGVLVVDEAYYEFSRETLVPKLDELPNVIVVRTMSKAFRMAGLRLGYGIANPDLLAGMRAVRMPYSLSAFTQAAGSIVLRRREEVLGTVDDIVAERDRIAKQLAAVGCQVFPSAGNFVLFRPPDAPAVMAALAKKGVVIRDFSTLPGCEGCLRVTAGLPSENDEFLEVVTAVAGR